MGCTVSLNLGTKQGVLPLWRSCLTKYNNLLFFDFEVFKEDWLVVIIDYATRTHKVIINDRGELHNIYQRAIDKKMIWVGYNSRFYDTVIMKAILNGRDPYEVSTRLVNKGEKEFQILSSTESENYPMINFDVSDRQHSLKQYEGYMGEMIKESDISFDLQRKLTDEEIKETVMYCTHDVEQTIEVFENKTADFDAHKSLIEMFMLDQEDYNKTKAQLVAKILSANRKSHDDEFDIIFPDTMKLDKYRYIYDWFNDPKNHNTKKKLYSNVGGIDHVFGWGGVHGCEDNIDYSGKIMCADVASLYPSIMIEYGLLSRNVEHPQLYKEIRDDRIRLKKAHDPLEAPLKIVLNSTYGISGDKRNPMYDPRMCRSVCVTGQLLLVDLIEKIEPYCRLLQSNTDGVYVAFDNDDNIPIVENLMHEWEKRTRLNLDIEFANRLVQKDVNNYILIHDDGTYKTKGAYVKKLSKIDYDLAICNKAIVNYFITGKSIADTIENNNSLIDYQKIIKVGGSYAKVTHNGHEVQERVLRVFATTNEKEGTIYKHKEGGNPEKVANTPEHAIIYNDKITPETNIALDKSYYIELAEQRLDDFLHGKGGSKERNEIKGVPNDVKNIMENINKTKHGSFYDLLENLKDIGCTKAQLISLVRLNRMDSFGTMNNLLMQIDIYNKYAKRKTLKVENIDENILEQVAECAGKRTPKTLSQLNNKKIFEIMINNVDVAPDKWYTIIVNELELLGYAETTIPNIPISYYMVTNVRVDNYGRVYTTLYNVALGITKTVELNKKKYKGLEAGDIIKAVFKTKKIKKLAGEQNGKKIYVDTGETRRWVWDYRKVEK